LGAEPHGNVGQGMPVSEKKRSRAAGKRSCSNRFGPSGGSRDCQSRLEKINRDGHQQGRRISAPSTRNAGVAAEWPGALASWAARTIQLNNTIGNQAEQAAQYGKRRRGQAGHDGQKTKQRGRDGQRLGLGENLSADVLAQVTALLFRRNTGHNHSGCRRNNQGRNLRHQPAPMVRGCTSWPRAAKSIPFWTVQ